MSADAGRDASPVECSALSPRAPRASIGVDGVLVVDKAPGMTSHDVVSRARRALGTRRVGHVGTLDPMATGVLPLVVGRATRLASLLSAGPKVYDGIIRLGVVTDTYDATGAESPEASDGDSPSPAAVTAATIDAAIASFIGRFMQHPPPFSAKKVGGVRAYRLARRREPVAPRPVEVTVHALEVISHTDERLRCRVTCEPGFYMRALAHDLGRALGCGGCLEALRRERSGAFDLTGAVPVGALADRSAPVTSHLVPLAQLLPDLPSAVLTDHGTQRARHGNRVSRADLLSWDRDWKHGPADGGRARVKLIDGTGNLLAIAEADGEHVLHPVIVLV